MTNLRLVYVTGHFTLYTLSTCADILPSGGHYERCVIPLTCWKLGLSLKAVKYDHM